MIIALYQPDMAPNVGSLMRFSACMGVALHVIEPCGFPLDDKRLRRTAMDYFDPALFFRHASWEGFEAAVQGSRLVLLTTKASQAYTEFRFRKDDVLLLGRESAGVPESMHSRADARISVPMRPGIRSLNLVQAACMIGGEALRQTQQFPG